MSRNPRRAKLPWMLAGAAAAVVLAAAWLGGGASVSMAALGGTQSRMAAPPSSAAPDPSANAALARVPVPAPAQAEASPLPRPPGVSAEQWQQLVAELSPQAGGAAELARLAEYLRFSDTLQRFRVARQQTGAAAELQRLARTLDAELDRHLQRRELHSGEARAIKSALLEVLQPDEALRQAALSRWQASAMPLTPEVAAARQRDAAFERQQSAIIAAWSARPPGERDQRALEAELAASRRASYPPAGRDAGPRTSDRRSP